MFAGQEKSSIDKDAGIGSLNCGIFSAQSPKGSTICLQFTNWFYLKVINGHEKGNFDSHGERFLLKSRFFWVKFRKNLNENVNFSVNWFFHGVFCGHQAMQFWQLCCNDFAEKRSFVGSKQKLIENLWVFQRKLHFGKSCPRQGKSSFEAPSYIIPAAVQFFLLKIAKIEQK